jgi:DNA-binding transcriptional LysR family regulator
MNLKFDDLDAFLHIYRAGNFTQASKNCGLTQSALSQKIARLEDTLQAAVFVRHPRSVSLTASGEKLLLYAKEVIQKQEDFLANFDQAGHELSGVIRIAGFSSVMRSIIIPKLAPLIRENPQISIEFSTHEMFELESVLKSNRADLIITDYFPQAGGLECTQIAEEEYVIIKARDIRSTPNIFLDHGPHDNATESYFKHTGKKIDYKRSYMGEVYSIIDGVAQGLGKAVMSKHLVNKDKRFIIEREKKRYIRPVVLSYFRQSYYSSLQKQVLTALNHS